MDLRIIHFSPTGGTLSAARILAAGISQHVSETDLTDTKADYGSLPFKPEDTVLIAIPSYSGRVPAAAAARISAMHGNGAMAILLCVYGNRAYEDTLIELSDTAKKAGFRPMAAATAIATHSIVPKYAQGRPDSEDRKRLNAMAASIRHKLDTGDDTEPQVPGNRPYRKAAKAGIIPNATSACIKCGICAAKCPAGAIDANDPSQTDKDKCISCMRCIHVCPHNARKASAVMLAAASIMLRKACSGRKDCELFL